MLRFALHLAAFAKCMDEDVDLGAGAEMPVEVACHPYKLLACSCQGRSALLGLVDDVDCAVVEASAPNAASPATLNHLSSIPALAYVAEGKLYLTALGLSGDLWDVPRFCLSRHQEDRYPTCLSVL